VRTRTPGGVGGVGVSSAPTRSTACNIGYAWPAPGHAELRVQRPRMSRALSARGGDQARRPGLPSQAETRSRTKLGLRIRTTIQMRADDGCVLAVSACPITCATGSTLILISLTTPRSTRHFTQSIASAPKASRATIRMGTSNGIDGSSSSTISPRPSSSLVLASWRASRRRDYPLGTFSCRRDWQALPLDQRSNTP